VNVLKVQIVTVNLTKTPFLGGKFLYQIVVIFLVYVLRYQKIFWKKMSPYTVLTPGLLEKKWQKSVTIREYFFWIYFFENLEKNREKIAQCNSPEVSTVLSKPLGFFDEK